MMTQGNSELSDFEYKFCSSMSRYTKAKVTKTTLNINALKLYYFETPTLSLTFSLHLSTIHSVHIHIALVRFRSDRLTILSIYISLLFSYLIDDV